MLASGESTENWSDGILKTYVDFVFNILYLIHVYTLDFIFRVSEFCFFMSLGGFSGNL